MATLKKPTISKRRYLLIPDKEFLSSTENYTKEFNRLNKLKEAPANKQLNPLN